MSQKKEKEMGHTPGPWETRWPKFDCTIVGHDRTEVATVFCAGYNQSRDHANCDLIASAPELLEALKAALQFLHQEIPRGPDIDGWANTVETVRTALAKAEGQS